MSDDRDDFYTDLIQEEQTGPDKRIGYVLEAESVDPEAGPVEPESDEDADADDEP